MAKKIEKFPYLGKYIALVKFKWSFLQHVLRFLHSHESSEIKPNDTRARVEERSQPGEDDRVAHFHLHVIDIAQLQRRNQK